MVTVQHIPEPERYRVASHGTILGQPTRTGGWMVEGSGGVFIYRFAPRPEMIARALDATREAFDIEEALGAIPVVHVSVKRTLKGVPWIEVESTLSGRADIPEFKRRMGEVARIAIGMKNLYEDPEYALDSNLRDAHRE